MPFPFHPHGTVSEVFLLPDRDNAFQPVDGFPACFKRGLSMRRSDDNHHTGLSDLQMSESVDYPNLVDRELPGELVANFAHLLKRHRLIGFVLQISSRPAPGMISYDSFKDYYRADFFPLQLAHQRKRINRPTRQPAEGFGLTALRRKL